MNASTTKVTCLSIQDQHEGYLCTILQYEIIYIGQWAPPWMNMDQGIKEIHHVLRHM